MEQSIKSESVFTVDGYYALQCKKLSVLQDDWCPKIGDRYERTYTIMEGTELEDSEKSIEILSYKSSADGWYHVSSANSESKLFNSTEELLKETCIYIPTIKDIMSRHETPIAIYLHRLTDLAKTLQKELPLESLILMDYASREWGLLWDIEDEHWRKPR